MVLNNQISTLHWNFNIYTYLKKQNPKMSHTHTHMTSRLPLAALTNFSRLFWP